jgi:hypothetical protein
MRTKTSLSEDFLYLWDKNAKEYKLTPEYKFHPTRRWRFDYALEPLRIAFEVEGGIWVNGRHNRATGFISDCEKYNEALLLGWRVFRVTHFSNTRVKTNEIIKQLILKIINKYLTPYDLGDII